MLAVLDDDPIHEGAEQVSVKCIYERRAFGQDVYQLLCLLNGLITLGLKDAAFFLLGLLELLCDGIAAGYKNIRINESLLLEHGQKLILIREIRYSLVQFDHIKAPQHPAALDLQVSGDDLR